MNRTLHIFGKEAREMLRDRRVLTSAFVGPLFMIVIFLMLFGFLQKTLTQKKSQTLYVVENSAGKTFGDALKDGFKVIYVKDAAEGEKLVQSGVAKALLEVPDNFSEELANGKPAKLKVTFDPEDQKAPIVVGQLKELIGKASKTRLEALLTASGINKDMAEPYQLDKHEIKREKAMAGSMIIGLLPYLIVIWAFYGGMATATDTVAGEKERNTLETLLISPV